jgi:hypothetical protein
MREPAVPAEELQKLIHQALLDLRKARGTRDERGTLRAESRMNALLDKLLRHTADKSLASAGAGGAVRRGDSV